MDGPHCQRLDKVFSLSIYLTVIHLLDVLILNGSRPSFPVSCSILGHNSAAPHPRRAPIRISGLIHLTLQNGPSKFQQVGHEDAGA